jgi:hypothetical protein
MHIHPYCYNISSIHIATMLVLFGFVLHAFNVILYYLYEGVGRYDHVLEK